ncbi:MAG: glycosyltransferase family 2 protein [Elusimicrobia bacterium]|nr:glycosyltransferase family 2 protein [Elusimicrobiota bacterium]
MDSLDFDKPPEKKAPELEKKPLSSPAPDPAPAVVYDRRTEAKPMVSFLVPVFNERAFIRKCLDRLAAVPLSKEIVIVDDGSTDRTRDFLAGNPVDGAVLLFHAKNQGKGGALRTALTKANGAYSAVQDADLEYDPGEYVDLLKYARQNNIKVVFGSRFLKSNPHPYRRFLWGNKALTAWINFLCASSYTDCYTGYKLMPTAVWRELGLVSRGFEVEAEICVKVAHRRHSFAELPISYAPRRVEEGKKISWKDAVRGLRAARFFAYAK